MTEPKRHHWWPQLQSSHWTNEHGTITVTRANGSTFRASPLKIGLEGDLYTRYDLTGSKDLTIERWFSNEIETPFSDALRAIYPIKDVQSSPFFGTATPEQKIQGKELQELGFVLPTKHEWIQLSSEHRNALVNYLATMLVRNPAYLRKLADFHGEHNSLPKLDVPADRIVKSMALDNMLHVYQIYQEAIASAEICLMLVDGDNELLFADTGISAQEPWRSGAIPFDIYAPLTPKLGINVLPVPGATTNICRITRINNRGVARYNRIILGRAERFVFSRGKPPIDFIRKNFGKPAPQSIGHRYVNGRLETKFDRNRDKTEN